VTVAQRRGLAANVVRIVHPAPREPVARSEPAQVLARGAPGMDGPRVEECTHVAERPCQLPIGTAAHEREAGVGRVEPEQDAQGCGLARAVRADEAGDDAGAHREGEAVHGDYGAVALPQAVDLDGRVHGF